MSPAKLSPARLFVLVVSTALLLAPLAYASNGPTPFPSEADKWPGRGVIRVFDWMSDRRERFWRERERQQGSVVFAGDSLTENWRTLAQDFPGMRLANRGMGGDVSRGLLFRFQEDVLALHPRAIVILIGINDLTARQLAADTLHNVAAMLDLRDAHSAATPVILCSVPPSAHPKAPVNERQRGALNDGLLALAERRNGVLFVDLFHALAREDGSPEPRFFKPDLLHLSEAGQARWKQVLMPALRKAGVL
jgi:lysophospholipase L1-like esterase